MALTTEQKDALHTATQIIAIFLMILFVWIASNESSQKAMYCGQVWSAVEQAHSCAENHTYPQVVCINQTIFNPTGSITWPKQ